MTRPDHHATSPSSRPERARPDAADLGVDGRQYRRGSRPISPSRTPREVVDGRGRLAFPGVVDAHQHWGIYNPLAEDTDTESRASAQGGVTTGDHLHAHRRSTT